MVVNIPQLIDDKGVKIDNPKSFVCKKTKMKIKSSKQPFKLKKMSLCNKMQSTENNQYLKSDLKEKTLRMISGVQNFNTNDIEENSLLISENIQDKQIIPSSIEPSDYIKEIASSSENNNKNILLQTIFRVIVCAIVLFTY